LVSDNSNIVIAKFDNSGNKVWIKVPHCIQSRQLWGLDGLQISVASSRENPQVFVSGLLPTDTSFFDDKMIVNTSQKVQIFLVSYNGQGFAQWVRASNDLPGTSCSGYGTAMCSDLHGNVYLGGQFQADSGFFGDPHIHAIEPRLGYDPYHSFLV